MDPLVQEILKDGVVTFPIPSPSPLHSLVTDILHDTREYEKPSDNISHLGHPIDAAHPPAFVVGGFGALGTASSFHSPPVRDIRDQVYTAVKPFLVGAYPGRKLEVLFDRFSVRRIGTSNSGESWHRDLGNKQPGDIIYGGWLNLDPPGTPPQRFSCVKGNVIPADIPNPKKGFAPFDKEEKDRLNADLATQGVIEVPPNHIILFDQSIAHKIQSGKNKRTSYRLYFGWRITDSDTPLYDKDSIIDSQSVPPLPSGEPAPMYAKLHWINWKVDILKPFSDSGFKPEFFDSTRPGYISRFFPGLVELGLAFPSYTPSERAMFFPQPLLLEAVSSEEPPAKKQRL